MSSTYQQSLAARWARQQQGGAVNHIDRLAHDIYARSEGDGVPSAEDAPLYRMYAVLCLAKGVETTNEDVHNAWVAWQAGKYPEHRSLKPFAELSSATQDLDWYYTRAIRTIAAERRPPEERAAVRREQGVRT